MVLAPSPKHRLDERKGMERRGAATPCAQPPRGASGHCGHLLGRSPEAAVGWAHFVSGSVQLPAPGYHPQSSASGRLVPALAFRLAFLGWS